LQHLRSPTKLGDMNGRVRVKICGITNKADCKRAVALGADAIGINFYTESPRYVTPEAASLILRELPPFVEAVGVFVDEPLKQVFPFLTQPTNQLSRIRTVQMHGSQREMCDAYPFHFIPAFAVKDADSLRETRRYLNACRAAGRMPSAILVDGHSPTQFGGTGRNPPWNILRGVQWDVPLILAGGLTPENVGEAIRTVRPYAVDVASGVEAEPGIKDVEKMQQFIENVRGAEVD
jgi:phosphoribosylanthranilate isomerase